ncbi:unnamed protein product [Urochloa humidicola]
MALRLRHHAYSRRQQLPVLASGAAGLLPYRRSVAGHGTEPSSAPSFPFFSSNREKPPAKSLAPRGAPSNPSCLHLLNLSPSAPNPPPTSLGDRTAGILVLVAARAPPHQEERAVVELARFCESDAADLRLSQPSAHPCHEDRRAGVCVCSANILRRRETTSEGNEQCEPEGGGDRKNRIQPVRHLSMAWWVNSWKCCPHSRKKQGGASVEFVWREKQLLFKVECMGLPFWLGF